eukprot:5049036-Pyramimonas_sp.AAC.1
MFRGNTLLRYESCHNGYLRAAVDMDTHQPPKQRRELLQTLHWQNGVVRAKRRSKGLTDY